MTITATRDTAVLIDVQALLGGDRDDEVGTLPLRDLLDRVGGVVRELDIGSLAAAIRAYADWRDDRTTAYRRELADCDVRGVQVTPATGPASAELIVDALSLAYDRPAVRAFVLVGSDDGLVPVVRRLHELGRHVVVAVPHRADGTVSAALRAAADHVELLPVPVRSADEAAEAAEAAGAPLRRHPAPTTAPLTAELRLPTKDEYRLTVLDLVRSDARLMIGGRVDVGALGHRLLRTWPADAHIRFGYRTLAAFVKDECGLEVLRHREAATELGSGAGTASESGSGGGERGGAGLDEVASVSEHVGAHQGSSSG